MNLRRFLAEAVTLVGLAIACALVSNAFAGKERQLPIPGSYQNATKVSPRADASPLPAFIAEQPSAVPAASDRAPTGVPQAIPAAGVAAAPRPAPTAPASAAAASTRPPEPKPVPAAELLARFPVHGQPYVEIPGDAAAWLHARGALFLDARRTKDFAQGHVGGARSFPVWEAALVKERVEGLVAEGRDQSLPVVLYCSGGECEDSHMLAQTLFGAGFENLLVYRDGFPDWMKQGGTVGSGATE
ncbi:MAG: rhodanese-like domain-containing protein [Holophagales bacterium]|nr:rhodanese-like domain-containing protein [Holophagales bacterium]